jgi:hypothetical protein
MKIRVRAATTLLGLLFLTSTAKAGPFGSVISPETPNLKETGILVVCSEIRDAAQKSWVYFEISFEVPVSQPGLQGEWTACLILFKDRKNRSADLSTSYAQGASGKIRAAFKVPVQRLSDCEFKLQNFGEKGVPGLFYKIDLEAFMNDPRHQAARDYLWD